MEDFRDDAVASPIKVLAAEVVEREARPVRSIVVDPRLWYLSVLGLRGVLGFRSKYSAGIASETSGIVLPVLVVEGSSVALLAWANVSP